MKKLLAILFATALLIFGTTTTGIYAKNNDPVKDIPEVYIPMPY